MVLPDNITDAARRGDLDAVKAWFAPGGRDPDDLHLVGPKFPITRPRGGNNGPITVVQIRRLPSRGCSVTRRICAWGAAPLPNPVCYLRKNQVLRSLYH